MHPLTHIPPATQRLLDVGCNAGELLHCSERLPGVRLHGVDVNASAIATARERVPGADLRLVTGSALPFPDAFFDCVTCIEMIEHVPAHDRLASVAEMARMLAPGGTLVLRCPHIGLFSWMDVANFRHRFPRLYRALPSRGLRESAYPGGEANIVWHHHFSQEELRSLLPPELSVEYMRYGGLFILPLTDVFRRPFYRARRYNHPLVRVLARLAEWDFGVNYGDSSYGILMVTRKAGGPAGDR